MILYETITNTHPGFEQPAPLEDKLDEVYAFHKSLPQYKPTELVELKDLAKTLGCKNICVKDESSRFGLNAFKALGASYAVSCLKDVKHLVSCTDGNHGRGLAWYGNLKGIPVDIFMPKGSEERRIRAIEMFNAKVTVTEFNYSDTVRYAAEYARKNGYTLVQDTAFDDYLEIPNNITLGYTTIIREALNQMDEEPTHVFLQAGVGSLAAGAIYALELLCKKEPYIGVVESDQAACIYESFKQKKIVSIKGNPYTIMAGLNCGDPSITALPVFEESADWFIKASDQLTINGMNRAVHPVGDDKAFVSGESGAVTLGLTEQICLDNREYFHIDENSVFLLISTEGILKNPE